MEDDQVAPSNIPSSAPRLNDIDRLFDDTQEAAQQANADEEDDQNGLGNFTSPMGQEMVLDSSDLISVDYPNEEIRTVLRNVADLYNLNLVIPDSLQGTTSIKLRDVTWRQIFNVVLDPVGYTFIEENGIIKVVSKEALNFEPPVTEIFMINYADAATIATTAKSLVDPAAGGSVQVDKRSNALIVSERASKMDSIRQVIERLDRPTQQVFIETRFIEVTDTDVKNIGLNWASLRGMGVAAGPFVHEYGKDFDRARIHEETVSRDVTTIGDNTTVATAFSNLGSLVDTKGITRNTSAVFSADQFGFVLSALKEQGGSRLVSNPTVVTLNNQEAEIRIGEEYPIPKYRYNEETGGFEVSDFEYKPIGVILRVTPSVNHTGLITLKVEPEVSSRTSSVSFGGASGAEIPIISTRRTLTQVALKDGFTMGIGGLMESSGLDNSNHVPVLGKIPGLGRLFKHNSTEESKLNLLIFITARILPSEEADFEDVFSREMMEDVGVDPVTLKNR